jgi:putative transposase
MNPAKVNEYDYINFLIAAQKVFSTVEASRTHPLGEQQVAHDAYTRLLQRLPPNSEALWGEVEPHIARHSGVLVLDDTTLDKPYARHMELVSRHWSGKHQQVVPGINVVSLLWTIGQGAVRLPCDFRIYHKATDGKTKNDHFRQMLAQAHTRGFQPEMVVFDSWYSGLKNLKAIRAYGWAWVTQLKANRQVSQHKGHHLAVSDLIIPYGGLIVHLKGYGWIKVFRIDTPNGDTQYWATSHLQMHLISLAFYALDAWQIEVYHQGVKQFTGIERGQFRRTVSQFNHIGLALRAFVRLELHRIHQQLSWFEAKHAIIRDAVRAYLASPTIILPPTA